MAANEDPKDVAATDKAYQAAVESVPAKAAPAAKAKPVKGADAKAQAKVAGPKPEGAKPLAGKAGVAPAPVKAEAKPAPVKVEAKPEPVKVEVKPEPVKVEAKLEPAKVEAKPVPAKVADAPKIATPVAAKADPKAKPVIAETKPVVAVKPEAEAGPKAVDAESRPAEKAIPVKAATPKPAVEVAREKKKEAVSVASPKAAISKGVKTAPQFAFAGLFTQFMLEDKTMDMSTNFSGFQDTMTEAQAKAKEVFEKSTKMLGEVGDFTKGNVEAVMESGKILAEGVQTMGSELVAEGRSAFEIVTSDIKDLAAAKSPTDFFKIQSDVMRKNFDSAVAYGSKNSEAMLKLVSDVMAPISGRVSMAMEKVRSASV